MPIPPRRIPHPPTSRSNRAYPVASPNSTNPIMSSLTPSSASPRYASNIVFAPRVPGVPKDENKLRPGMYSVKKGGKATAWDLDVGEDAVGAKNDSSNSRLGRGKSIVEGNQVAAVGDNMVIDGDVETARRGVEQLNLGPDEGSASSSLPASGARLEDKKTVVGLAELIESGKGRNRAPRQPIAQSMGFSLVLSPVANVLALPDEEDVPSVVNSPRNALPSGLSCTMPGSFPGLSKAHAGPAESRPSGAAISPNTGVIGTTPELSTSFGTPGTDADPTETESIESRHNEDDEWENVSRPGRGSRGITGQRADGAADSWVGVEDDEDEDVMFFEVDAFEGDVNLVKGVGGILTGDVKASASGLDYARALRGVV